ncbi:MAG: alpha-ketoglutarate-dependent dioxygenase AlkB [Ilumatobacter sp.]|uniref:alpha-ketoglutarate-dependent dioxygenase AlkB n=1 Tax=Ilumatobacter sp. TaxID=1967498 RepID=UPI00262BC3A9|nr:alpha-ketoglutarate-dependent dioxygenase AlkB [Ilumatobacter sp.]MDJ0771562.1 alpha-ketoglutarate-dependent dioxygenase AlkB [Ilumatobacter sp.]
MFYQGSLFGTLVPEFDESFAELQRLDLDATTWVDLAPGWLTGADQIYDQLVALLPFRQRTGVRMFDQIVDEPRLSAWWRLESGEPEPMPILHGMRLLLAERYDEPFDSIGFNLYRDGDDSVAWHGDRHRHVVTNPVIAIVSVGSPRPLRLRPRGGGTSLSWSLGNGDLFVMGGACQHEWEHTVPKVRVTHGPRMSITFRSV